MGYRFFRCLPLAPDRWRQAQRAARIAASSVFQRSSWKFDQLTPITRPCACEADGSCANRIPAQRQGQALLQRRMLVQMNPPLHRRIHETVIRRDDPHRVAV